MSKAHTDRQKVVVVGAGPVGALAALYAASRGDDVEVYELRDGEYLSSIFCNLIAATNIFKKNELLVLLVCPNHSLRGML